MIHHDNAYLYRYESVKKYFICTFWIYLCLYKCSSQFWFDNAFVEIQ